MQLSIIPIVVIILTRKVLAGRVAALFAMVCDFSDAFVYCLSFAYCSFRLDLCALKRHYYFSFCPVAIVRPYHRQIKTACRLPCKSIRLEWIIMRTIMEESCSIWIDRDCSFIFIALNFLLSLFKLYSNILEKKVLKQASRLIFT